MNKNVWIGSAVGLLFLAVLGTGWWVWQGGNQVAAPGAMSQGAAPRAAALGAMPMPSQEMAGATRPGSGASNTSLDPGAEARRKRVKQIRAELAAIQAQGAQASPAQVKALINELEALSPGQFDPRYFRALRDMLEGSAQVQALNRELQALASSTVPSDVTRRQAILAELQSISARISASAVDLQTYARRPAGQAKAP